MQLKIQKKGSNIDFTLFIIILLIICFFLIWLYQKGYLKGLLS